MRLIVSGRAKLDLMREEERYEGEREGLGGRFAKEMEEVIGRIAQRPLGFPQFAGARSRRALGKRFPFMVVFDVQGDVIYVTAVVHQHAEPASYRGK